MLKWRFLRRSRRGILNSRLRSLRNDNGYGNDNAKKQ